jgi:diguanylate cyclase (GGDEF)-like protein
VLFVGVDNFKLVNESLGHRAGDELLVQLAERLRACIRDTDLVARQGGDEFLVLLSDLDGDGVLGAERETNVAVSEAVAHRIEQALQEPFELAGTAVRVSVSTGICLYPQDGLTTESLLQSADAALNQAKRHAPGSHVYYAATEHRPMEKLALSTRLRHAVEEERWILHYQPILELPERRIVGVEALVRWQEPDGTMVPPGQFIPLAEELGLIEAIGDWVIGEMARQHRAWADAGLDLEMSFNLSPRQLWSDRLAERLLGGLREADVDPRRVVVEITESAAMTDADRTHRILAELHDAGLRLAIDDFGTGYSSLSRLRTMPVDVLKIDQQFIRGVHEDATLAGMVRAMVELTNSLGMTALAEGVETAGEDTFLRSTGCRLAQGFYFARPVPAAEIPALVAAR